MGNVNFSFSISVEQENIKRKRRDWMLSAKQQYTINIPNCTIAALSQMFMKTLTTFFTLHQMQPTIMLVDF